MRKPITTGHRDRETELVAKLAQTIPSIGHIGNSTSLMTGVGDDSAVLRPSPRSDWVISCDLSLEGAHFQSDYPPDSIGYKSLARATSDLAAMGAQSRYFLLALALPAAKTGKWLTRFASGMSRAAHEFRSFLIGGDISKSSSVTICITVLGELPAGLAIPRFSARRGDLIYVSGTLGAAQLGLEIVLRGWSRQPSLKKYLQPHFYPQVPVALGQALARQRIPSAMMDISDGLSTDLARLCAASGVGARIWADKLLAVRVPVALLARRIDPLALALHGGEDYGLLFTVPPKSAPRLRRLAHYAHITQIGEITRARKIVLIHRDGHSSPLPSKGWNPLTK
ncbi:MAG: thiamine-phosphate kinase [Candidatus Acidiferrales bacterium]